MKKVFMCFTVLFLLVLPSCVDDEVKEFSISYFDYDGTLLQEEVYELGATLTTVEEPSREGYTFEQWDVSIPISMPEENLEVKATYTVNSYTINYFDYDGALLESEVFEFGASIISIDIPLREGFTFDDWDEELPNTMPANDVDVSATYTVDSYSIDYLDYDGTILQTVLYDYGETIIPIVAIREGYSFSSWDVVLPETMPASDIDVTATYTINSYVVSYVDEAGTILNTITYEYGTEIVMSPPEDLVKEGFVFDGWDQDLPDTMPANDIEIGPVFTANSYTLNYLDFDGSVLQSFTYDCGAEIDQTLIEDPIRVGYDFIAWDMAIPNQMPHYDMEFTAEYVLSQLVIELLGKDVWDYTNIIDLPRRASDSSLITWNSSNSTIVTRTGVVLNPPIGGEAVDVTLTATFYSDSFSGVVDFIFTIEPNPEVVIDHSVMLPFDNESIRFTLDETAELEIFYEENGNIPYVDIEGFLAFIDGSIEYSLLDFAYSENQLVIEYTRDDFVFDGYLANGTHTATFDFVNNTVTISSYEFFRGYFIPSGLNPYENIIYQSHESTEVSETIIPLGEYNVDLTIYNDGESDHHLMPFHIANLLFLHASRFNVYYNGVKITGYDDAYVAWDENELDPALYEMNFGPLNSEDLPFDLRVATYHHLALTFDYFHGIKDEDNRETFYDVIDSELWNIILGSEDNFGRSVWMSLIRADDPGTWYSRVGYYDDRPLYYYEPDYAFSMTRIRSLFTNYYDAKVVIDAGLGTDLTNTNIHIEDTDDYLPEVRLIDNETTAIIYLVEFYDHTPDDIKLILDNLPITVENVIFDTSVSFFGKTHNALEILGFMTDQPIEYTVKNTVDGQITNYTVLVDQPYYDYNYYIISSEFTYGIANIFIQIAKDNGIAIHIGLETIGGSCPLTSATLTDGTNYMTTSTTMFLRRVGNEIDGYTYESYEFGISPDYILEHYTTEQDIIDLLISVG